MSGPELPSLDPDADPEEQEATIREAASKAKRDRDRKTSEFVQSLKEEHGGNEVETEVQLADDITVTARVDFSKEFVDRMREIQSEASEAAEAESIKDFDAAMWDAARVLDEIVVEEEYDAPKFYDVYAEGDAILLAKIAKLILENVKEEASEVVDGMDGFR